MLFENYILAHIAYPKTHWSDGTKSWMSCMMKVSQYEGDKNYNHITKYLRDEARSYHIQLRQRDRYIYSKIVDELYALIKNCFEELSSILSNTQCLRSCGASFPQEIYEVPRQASWRWVSALWCSIPACRIAIIRWYLAGWPSQDLLCPSDPEELPFHRFTENSKHPFQHHHRRDPWFQGFWDTKDSSALEPTFLSSLRRCSRLSFYSMGSALRTQLHSYSASSLLSVWNQRTVGFANSSNNKTCPADSWCTWLASWYLPSCQEAEAIKQAISLSLPEMELHALPMCQPCGKMRSGLYMLNELQKSCCVTLTPPDRLIHFFCFEFFESLINLVINPERSKRKQNENRQTLAYPPHHRFSPSSSSLKPQLKSHQSASLFPTPFMFAARFGRNSSFANFWIWEN